MQYFVLDLTKSSSEDITKIAKEAEKKFGPIEILFNNAGICKPGMLLDDKIDALDSAR